METMPSLARLSDMLPDNLKEVIRDKYVLEGKNLDELHKILYKIRNQYMVAPWSVLTLYFKRYATDFRSGKHMSGYNRWTFAYTREYDYTRKDLSNKWVRLFITVKRDGVAVSAPVTVAVHPRGKIVWSYISESPVSTGLSIIGLNGEKLHISHNWMLTTAKKFVRGGCVDGQQVAADYDINLKLSQVRKDILAKKYNERMDALAAALPSDTTVEATHEDTVQEAQPKHENVLDVASEYVSLPRRVVSDLPHIAAVALKSFLSIGDDLMVDSCKYLITLLSEKETANEK